MRTVVLVSYHFPPFGGKAVQRASKLAKYLPSFGWKPVVFTLPLTERRVPIDETLLRELPDEVEIHRPRYRDWRRLVPHDLRRFARQPIPDKYRSWARASEGRLAELVHTSGAEAMISTSPTHSAQILALSAKRVTGVPWIADFRDPWTGDPSFGRRAGGEEQVRLETDVVKNADAVVGVCPKILRDFADRAPAEKLHLIENGYDESDFDEVGWSAPPAEKETLTLGYNGTVSAYHDPGPVLEALRRMLTNGVVERGSIRVVFTTVSTGNARFKQSRDLEEAGMFEVRDYLPHARSLAEQARLDVSLLLLTGGEGLYPAKVFEYLRLGNPVLSISPTGDDLSRLLDDVNGEIVVAPDDIGGIASALRYLLERKKAGRLPHLRPDLERVSRYSRERIAERYAQLLSAVAR